MILRSHRKAVWWYCVPTGSPLGSGPSIRLLEPILSCLHTAEIELQVHDRVAASSATVLTMLVCVLYMYLTRSLDNLESDDLTLLSNSTPEQILDDLAIQHGLCNDALDVLRADSTIPDTLAS